MQDVFEVSDLAVGHGTLSLLEGVSFTVGSAESLALTGDSGCGKSSLLMSLVGLLRASAGHIAGFGHPGVGASRRALAQWRLRNCGLVYQFGELLPDLDALDNVALPGLLAGRERREVYREARVLLDDLGVEPATSALHLSGGERQRAALARALINRPGIVFADEPTGSLDPATGEQVAKLLLTYTAERRCALILVTHSPRLAGLTDRCLALTGGERVR